MPHKSSLESIAISAARRASLRRIGIALLFVFGALALVIPFHPASPAWPSLLPPLAAVLIALVTHRVLLSLAAAVLLGGLLVDVPAAPHSFEAWIAGLTRATRSVSNTFVVIKNDGAANIQWHNIKIMVFVILMMATIMVAVVSGGLLGIVNRVARLARGPRSTQVATALAGIVVFIDDYANSMIVGNSMRSLTDRHRVSREKLAFLVDATSAPIAGLAFISTWIGFEVSLFQQQADSLAIARDGYALFLDALPFRFYCLMAVLFVFVNAITGKDFGPMAQAEKRARGGDPVGPPAALGLPRSSEPHASAKVWAASGIVPLVGLIATLIFTLWLDVIGFERLIKNPLMLLSEQGWREVFLSTEKDLNLGLAVSGAVGLSLAAACAIGLGRVPLRQVGRAALVGVRVSIVPALILILAWSLKNACDELKTADYLRAVVSEIASPIWFPPMVFLVAGLTAFAVGSSWATMLILIPTATPIAFQLDGGMYGPVTIICLAAVLDGAIFGDHCSPISDTTILSSTAAGCDHLRHVRTQLPYSVVIAVLALVCGYLPAALGVSPWLCILLALAMTVTLFALLRPLEGGKN